MTDRRTFVAITGYTINPKVSFSITVFTIISMLLCFQRFNNCIYNNFKGCCITFTVQFDLPFSGIHQHNYNSIKLLIQSI